MQFSHSVYEMQMIIFFFYAFCSSFNCQKQSIKPLPIPLVWKGREITQRHRSIQISQDIYGCFYVVFMSSVELVFFPHIFISFFFFAHSYLIFGGVTTTQLWIQLWFMTIMSNTEYMHNYDDDGLCFCYSKYRNIVYWKRFHFSSNEDPNDIVCHLMQHFCMWELSKRVFHLFGSI